MPDCESVFVGEPADLRHQPEHQFVVGTDETGDDISETDHKRPLARPNSNEICQPQDPPHPERLGWFKIEKPPLGRGAFGDVYVAYDPELNRKVALEVPRRERFSSPEDMSAFVNPIN